MAYVTGAVPSSRIDAHLLGEPKPVIGFLDVRRAHQDFAGYARAGHGNRPGRRTVRFQGDDCQAGTLHRRSDAHAVPGTGNRSGCRFRFCRLDFLEADVRDRECLRHAIGGVQRRSRQDLLHVNKQWFGHRRPGGQEQADTAQRRTPCFVQGVAGGHDIVEGRRRGEDHRSVDGSHSISQGPRRQGPGGRNIHVRSDGNRAKRRAQEGKRCEPRNEPGPFLDAERPGYGIPHCRQLAVRVEDPFRGAGGTGGEKHCGRRIGIA
ncbi:hypothetical protein PJL18_01799 [Paenarthrobacter nicotinovorans]|nr:hypothetical protein [Paenarthrobacter nicotinovorans]